MFKAESYGYGRDEEFGGAAAETADPQVTPGTSEFGNRYTRAYKLKVLRESDGCTKPGEMGKYLRRMGLQEAAGSGHARCSGGGGYEGKDRSGA